MKHLNAFVDDESRIYRTPASGRKMDSSPELKILVADDSPVYRKLVEQSLSKEHYTSGIDLCQTIRRNFQGHYAYIILLTGNTDKEEVITGLAAEPTTTPTILA
jgi:CheY-like chemotaxis protein